MLVLGTSSVVMYSFGLSDIVYIFGIYIYVPVLLQGFRNVILTEHSLFL